jgi:hypothetical protein
MAKKVKMTKEQELQKLLNWIAFLKKRLESKNFQANATPEERNKAKEQYDRAKFRLKTLKM